MTNGYYQMHRDWMKNPVFRRESFTEREAFLYLIEHAAWKPTTQVVGEWNVRVERGQFATSIRFLANAWDWRKGRVERFIKRLETETMIGTATGTRYSVITVCNYDIYQAEPSSTGTQNETATGTRAGHGQDKEEEKDKKDKKNYTDDFPAFWAAYPARTGYGNPRNPAEQLFGSWVKDGTPPQEMISAATNYCAHTVEKATEPQFIMQAKTFLAKKNALWKEWAAMERANGHTEPFTPKVEAMREQRKKEELEK